MADTLYDLWAKRNPDFETRYEPLLRQYCDYGKGYNEYTESSLLSDVFGNPISEDEALNLIKSVPEAFKIFSAFNDNNKRLVLDFMQRNNSLKISSDVLFKYIFDGKC